MKISTRGNIAKSTYDEALEVGGEIYPELLGENVSILRRERFSNITKEYKQKAKLLSIREKKETKAIELVDLDIFDLESLVKLESDGRGQEDKDQLYKKLNQLYKAREELQPVKHTENQLIFRDVYNVERSIPVLSLGKSAKTFNLPNSDNLRIRVLHPEIPEHITGADLIYEYHYKESEKVSLVFIQYKIWEDKKLYLSDERLNNQLKRLESFTCSKGLCDCIDKNKNSYRFPYCTSFLRPTDALQRADQTLISRGEYIPICKINKSKTIGIRKGEYLDYKGIKDVSLSSLLFEDLFNGGKIGSKRLSYEELSELYRSSDIINSEEKVIIYAQDCNF